MHTTKKVLFTTQSTSRPRTDYSSLLAPVASTRMLYPSLHHGDRSLRNPWCCSRLPRHSWLDNGYVRASVYESFRILHTFHLDGETQVTIEYSSGRTTLSQVARGLHRCTETPSCCLMRAFHLKEIRSLHSEFYVPRASPRDVLLRLGDAARRNNDFAVLMPRHVILAGRVDKQSNTGRFIWEIPGQTGSAANRTSLLHLVLCAETSVLGTDSLGVQGHSRAAETASEMATPLCNFFVVRVLL